MRWLSLGPATSKRYMPCEPVLPASQPAPPAPRCQSRTTPERYSDSPRPVVVCGDGPSLSLLRPRHHHHDGTRLPPGRANRPHPPPRPRAFRLGTCVACVQRLEAELKQSYATKNFTLKVKAGSHCRPLLGAAVLGWRPARWRRRAQAEDANWLWHHTQLHHEVVNAICISWHVCV